MAFTTSDNFQYAKVALYEFHPGQLLQGQQIRMVIIFIMLLDEVDSQRLKLVRKHIRIGKYLKRHGH